MEGEIGRKNQNVEVGNKRLKAEIRAIIESEKQRVQKEDLILESAIKKIPVKLEKRPSPISTMSFQVREKIQPIMPEARKREEFVLDRSKVDGVIELLRNGGRSFETTPCVYSKMEEEDLRDVLLGWLNAVFEGEATGETFLKSGKTDIHLRVAKGGVLAAECKFWDGERQYQRALEQLFGYLTWQQNYGVLITFSKRKEFSEVLARARGATTNHGSYMPDSLSQLDEAYFITQHRHPEDVKKAVEVRHLLFSISHEAPREQGGLA